MEAGRLDQHQFIPYSHTGYQLQAILLCVIGFFAGAANIICIRGLMRKPSSPVLITMFALLAENFFLSTSDIIFTSRNLANGGWRGGSDICYALFTVYVTGAFAHMATVCLLAFVRMKSLKKVLLMNETQVKIFLAILWPVSLLVTTIPFMMGAQGNAIALQPSLQHCEPNFSSGDPRVLTFTLSGIFIAILCPMVLLYLYSRIYLSFSNTKKKIISTMPMEDHVVQTDEEEKAFSTHSIYILQRVELKRQEHSIFIQSMLIVCGAFLSWAPVAIAGISPVVGIPHFPNLHVIYNFTIAMNRLVEPLIILFWNRKAE
jgi:hypothetical protein